eukprot:scaffold319029_cov40-Tisochrysis_lutea.AAC.2
MIQRKSDIRREGSRSRNGVNGVTVHPYAYVRIFYLCPFLADYGAYRPAAARVRARARARGSPAMSHIIDKLNLTGTASLAEELDSEHLRQYHRTRHEAITPTDRCVRPLRPLSQRS